MALTPAAARELFPVTRDTIYLQHGGHSVMSTRTRDAVERVARTVTASNEWDGYQADWEGLRTSLARLIAVDADEVTLTRGTAQGISILARGLEWQPDDNVVSVYGEYPTNVFPWTLLRKRGVDFRRAELTDGRIDVDALFELVDARTRAVSISWVQWWNGYRCDLAAIGEECRRRGVLFCVDAIQGVGAVQIDAPACNVDVLACGASKWLFGPPGAGFAYVRPEVMDDLFPPLVGGGNVVIQPGEPFHELDELKPDARRYEESAISWFDIAALKAGVDMLHEIGMEVVEEHVLGLARYMGEQLAARGYAMVEPWPRSVEESSGMVSIRPKTPAAEAVETLGGKGIVCRLYRDLMRFSTHVINTRDELDHVLEVMDGCVEA
jgi:cysteine desulfurase / selenocysteine lyase